MCTSYHFQLTSSYLMNHLRYIRSLLVGLHPTQSDHRADSNSDTRFKFPALPKKKKKWNQTTMNIHHTPKLCVVHVSKCFPTSPWCLNSHSHSISLPRGIIPCVLKGRQEYSSWGTVSQNHCCWVKVPKLCLWSRKGWKADQKCRMDQVWGVEIEVPVRVIWRQKV